MQDSSIVYKNMSATELARAYDVFQTIDDPIAWLEANQERAKLEAAKLSPIKNVSYGHDAVQKLDIYVPRRAHLAPVLIDIHGGGWSAGSKEPRALQAQGVTSAGCLWVPIDYGLAPDYSVDKMVDHVYQAIAWIYKNIQAYGGDPQQVFLFGHSAGGHLAATTLMPHWHRSYALPEDVIKGFVLTSGIFDLESQVHEGGHLQKMLQMSIENAHRASPLFHLPDQPKDVIIAYSQAELPAFISESKAYAKALQSVGCNVLIIEVEKLNHFDMINALCDTQGALYQSVMRMVGKREF